MSDEPRMAVAYDWLQAWRGGETVLAAVLRLYPSADLFAVVDFLPDSLRPRIGGKRAHTTFVQNVPGARRWFRYLLPLFPRAIESLDLSRYDIVMSISHAVAKGVRTRKDQLHICYCNTPMRYAWDLREQYLPGDGLGAGWKGRLAHRMLDRIREWDRRTSDRVTHFIANSQFVRDRIARCYERDADVIYPPVDTSFYSPAPSPATRSDYYVTASHWVPYKRLDVIVQAFARLGDRRLIVAGTGPQTAAARAAAPANVTFEGEVTRERLRDLMRHARAFVFAAEEDFGIVPVEAQACGTPVIAFGRGGARETVRADTEHPTGAFFTEQTPDALAAAVAAFETVHFDAADCRMQAQRFDQASFDRAITSYVDERWRAFRRS